ncbi:MAG: hypothetical protein RBT49_15670 [Bacteroidales bacterium]|nr:hypothetical protein [Bacteroidales bacterium]
MVDTIRIRTRVRNLDETKIFEFSCQKVGNLKYRYFKDVITVGSWSRDLNFVIRDDLTLVFEFSLPKFYFNHNLHLASFEMINDALNDIRKSFLSICDIPEIDDWDCMRIDLCDYLDTTDAYHSLSLLKHISFPRKKSYYYDTSVMYVGNSYSTKVYLKYPEFMINDFMAIKKVDLGYAMQLKNLADNKLRVETTYRSKWLKENLGTIKTPKIKDIIIKKNKLINHFKYTKKKLLLNVNPMLMVQKNLLKELKQLYPKKKNTALRIYQFYVLYYNTYDFNKRAIEQLYSKSTICRYKFIISSILSQSYVNDIDVQYRIGMITNKQYKHFKSMASCSSSSS